MLTGAHPHLLVNHVSLFALVFGVVLLAFSMWRKSVELRMVAAILFIITGLFAWIAFETGETAEDVIKALNGDTESLIKNHFEAALWAIRSGYLVATLAIIMEVVARKKPSWLKPVQWVLLIAAIHGCTVFAVTALQGGKIRHTEVRD